MRIVQQMLPFAIYRLQILQQKQGEERVKAAICPQFTLFQHLLSSRPVLEGKNCLRLGGANASGIPAPWRDGGVSGRRAATLWVSPIREKRKRKKKGKKKKRTILNKIGRSRGRSPPPRTKPRERRPSPVLRRPGTLLHSPSRPRLPHPSPLYDARCHRQPHKKVSASGPLRGVNRLPNLSVGGRAPERERCPPQSAGPNQCRMK